MMLSKCGAIRTMLIPAGWIQTANEANYRQYKAPGAATASLASLVRKCNELGVLALRRRLAGAGGELSKTEWAAVTMAVGNMSDDETFELAAANVIRLAGAQVLSVQGTYLTVGQRCRSIFVPIRLDYVQQIFFQATELEFDEFIHPVEAVLDAIEWSDE